MGGCCSGDVPSRSAGRSRPDATSTHVNSSKVCLESAVTLSTLERYCLNETACVASHRKSCRGLARKPRATHRGQTVESKQRGSGRVVPQKHRSGVAFYFRRSSLTFETKNVERRGCEKTREDKEENQFEKFGGAATGTEGPTVSPRTNSRIV